MNSIKYDFVFLIIFIVVVIAALIVPQYINEGEEDYVQVDIDQIIEQDTVELNMNETLIKDELVINLT